MPQSKAKLSFAAREKIERTLLLLPGVLLYAVFYFIPMLGLLYLSQVKWAGIGPMEYVGFDNFRQVLGNAYFRDQLFQALWQNAVFFLVIIGSFLTIGSGLALLLSLKTWGRKLYQIIFFLPYPMAGAAVAYLLNLFVAQRGPLNALLMSWGITDHPIPFLGLEDTALVTLALFYSWHRMGFAIMLILAGILAVRQDLLEAAVLDGASRWQAIKAVVAPVVAPAFILITVIIMVDVFNNADYTLIIMGPEAGPLRSTDVMGTFLFRTAFGAGASTVNTNFGMAAAVGLITAVMILPAALFLALRNFRND
ncbi:carbohydrate ABC transporter permease [Salinispirillum marinum]|uniref:Carbohydrate ABC transporter permease n=2 Tax=Saccharospirillaceae TaxID=255527 RepID=A0ABV8BK08_9GAMM